MSQSTKTFKNPRKSGNTSAKSQKNRKKGQNNQKKMHKSSYNVSQKDQNQNSNYTKFSGKIFKESSYMPDFIKEVANNDTLCKCMKCQDPETKKTGKIIMVNNIYSHLKSKQHKNNTPSDEDEKLEELLKLLEEKSKDKPNKEQFNEEQDIVNYLHFIAFAISHNLSYSQIESLGTYLQKASREKKLGFFKNFSFDEHLMSKITQDCFRPILLQEMRNQLSIAPYSLVIDNATFSGDSVCALKVKYLITEWDQNLKENITQIKNKIISLSNLKESSSGLSLKNVIEERLFSSESIKNQFFGLTHDNASSLTSPNCGVVALLEQNGNNFFDLKDPCHGLNLTLKHSLKELPSKLMDFVESITNYFAYPQRKAALKKIQEDNNLFIRFPKQLAPTRWLSLGDCLVRLIEIWESLVKYFEKYKNQQTSQKKKKIKASNAEGRKKKMSSKEINELLNDEVFYLQINFLSYVVNVINKYNKRFQDQQMDICGLKNNLNECYNSILDLLTNSKATLMGKTELLKLDWEDTATQEELFFISEEFISNINDELGSKYGALKQKDVKIQEEFTSIFYKFIRKILNLLGEYLPLDNSLIDIFDFVELKDNFMVLKEKIKQFNKKFNIIGEENMTKLKEELIKLKNTKIEFYRNSTNSLLHMWDRLEKEENLVFLPKIMKVAQTLPTSSATIEQSFSVIKLLKTSLRNKLSQSSLEGLVFVGQEFREKNDFTISNEMVELYKDVKKAFNDQKGGLKKLKSQSENQIQSLLEKKDKVDPKPLNEDQFMHIEYVKGEEEREILEGLSEQISLLSIPEGEIIDEKSKEGKKRKKPLAELLKGMEELEGKEFSFKKPKKKDQHKKYVE